MTGSDFVTALIYGGPIVGIVIAVAVVALFICERIEIREAQARERAASLDYWRDTNPELAEVAELAWEDHPAYRADIAKTRTQNARRRMNRETWEQMGGGAA